MLFRSLELNPFLPLIAKCLLDSCKLLTQGCDILRNLCVEGITANEGRCRQHVDGSTATATALIPLLGYEKSCQCVVQAQRDKKTIRQIVLEQKLLSQEQFDELIAPETVCRLGTPDKSNKTEE